MICGLGTDITEISRMQSSLNRYGAKFKKRVFTSLEQEYCAGKSLEASHFAARFAAKEALLKALGTGLRAGMTWQDMEVCRDPLGRPWMKFSGKVREMMSEQKIEHCHLSLSHSKEYALATVVLER